MMPVSWFAPCCRGDQRFEPSPVCCPVWAPGIYKKWLSQPSLLCRLVMGKGAVSRSPAPTPWFLMCSAGAGSCHTNLKSHSPAFCILRPHSPWYMLWWQCHLKISANDRTQNHGESRQYTGRKGGGQHSTLRSSCTANQGAWYITTYPDKVWSL